MSIKTLLMDNKKKVCLGVVETNGNVSYDVLIQRDGETIYSLPTSINSEEYYRYDVVLEVGDVIVPHSGNLHLYNARNIEFKQEIEQVYFGAIGTYVDAISKLTVSSIQNDFYFQTGCYFVGMSGGSND